MDKVKRLILCRIPMSICNFRCRYCYLAQRDECYQGKQADFKYSPEYVAKAFSMERLGGACYFNFCADGETLLTKDIEKYIYAVAKEGHYIEIVTNLTITKVLDKILDFEQDVLDHITFKCSFHYLQLKERNLLNVFADNVNKIWAHHCSANIEITPDDELIPYIDEVKEYSIKNFGALPHLSIARDDRTGHDYLTKLSLEEYDKIWGQFDSGFWRFKKTIFNQKRNEFCYAGAWSLYVDLTTGNATQCYCSRYNQNIFKGVNKPINFLPIGKCPDTHCYNGHALLTLGCIPRFTDVKYGEIRDRIKTDGTHWIQPKMLCFLNSKLDESNKLMTDEEKKKSERKLRAYKIKSIPKRVIRRVKRFFK